MNKVEKLVFTAMMVSAAFVIAVLMKAMPLMRMPNGGSISLAMLPLFILGFTLGLKYGLMGGVVYAVVNFISDGYAFHWASLIFDYLIAFGVIGLSGLFNKYALKGKKPINYVYFILGIIIPSLLRLASHTLAGMLAWETPFWASLTYNAPYLLISTAVCLVVGLIIYPYLSKYVVKKTNKGVA